MVKERDLEHKVCVWYNNGNSKKVEVPEICKLLKCKGYNDFCGKYQPKYDFPKNDYEAGV